MLLNWQGRHFMEINHSRITSYEIANYMIRTKSLLSAKELAAILEKEYPHLDVDKRDVYLRLAVKIRACTLINVLMPTFKPQRP